MTDDTLQRFFAALVEALRERSPGDLRGPFTVAEIYQDLVPYRTHRDRLGFEINGDYEHALLRLLAGREGYLRLGSEHALDEIRSELDSKHPDTSLYRDFAGVDVRIEPAMLPPEDEGDDADDGDDASPERAAPLGEMDSLASDAGSGPDTSEEPTTFVEGAEPGTSSPVPEGNAPDRAVCHWCRSDLPGREGLVYCPFCGEDQSREPCRSCGEALEPEWEFCISCGVRKGQ